jgi:hypothetical protein
VKLADLCIRSSGLVTPFGVGRQEFLRGLQEGQARWQTRQRREGEERRQPPEDSPTRRVAEAAVPELDPADHGPSRGLRRAMDYVRYGVVACGEALRPVPDEVLGERCGLILASAYGSCRASYQFWHGILKEGPLGASPTLFSEGVPNALAGHVGRLFRVQGPTSMLTGGFDVGLRGLSLAADLLHTRRADCVLTGAAEELSEVAGRGLARFRVVRKGGAEPPGMVFSEGSAALVLQRREDVEASGRLAGEPAVLMTLRAIQSRQLPDLTSEDSARRLADLLDRTCAAAGLLASKSVTSGPLWYGGAHNGTRANALEARALQLLRNEEHPLAEAFRNQSRVRDLIGEALSVTPLWQIIEATPEVQAGSNALIVSVSPYGACTAVVLGPPS